MFRRILLAALAVILAIQLYHPAIPAKPPAAGIPDRVQSVEFVETGAQGSPAHYRRFNGDTLAEEHVSQALADERAHHILSLAPPQLR